jgi:hypothetical protein
MVGLEHSLIKISLFCSRQSFFIKLVISEHADASFMSARLAIMAHSQVKVE